MKEDKYEDNITNSSEEEEDIGDGIKEEIDDKLFPNKYIIADESSTSLHQYILNMCTDRSFSRLACGLSNNVVHIYEISNGIFPLNAIEIPKGKVCGVKFLDESPNCLLVGSDNGQVRLFDLRTLKEQTCFDAIANDTPETITCFDRNANSRILCMGSECSQMQDVYLFFFDIRKNDSLGQYFESHSEDVTSVRFHPTNPDTLSTGCTKGLINVFDISQNDESDALMMTINAESSVYKLNWHKNVYEKDIISCITHDNGLKIYKSEEGEGVVDFKRNNITETIQRKCVSNLNLVNCHDMQDGNLLLLAGSVSNRGEILQSIMIQNKDIFPHGNFEGNKQIVRESVYESKSNCIVTGGESSILTLWSAAEKDMSSSSLASDSNKLKAKSNSRSSRIHKKAPY